MCGIVGAVGQTNVVPVLLDGLSRLEYRGYDSAGLCVLADQQLRCLRTVGKVARLQQAVSESRPQGQTGIAHTRWATHGKPSEVNAHPHICNDSLAVVHNGIIENYRELKNHQQAQGDHFLSATDTEVIAHQIGHCLKNHSSLLVATSQAVRSLQGAYAIGVVSSAHPDEIIAARNGSPLVIGVGDDQCFIASDPMALLSVTRRFIYLEEGDIARVTRTEIYIEDQHGKAVNRQMITFDAHVATATKGQYKHYMLKEIFEQPQALKATWEGRLSEKRLLEESFGHQAKAIFDQTKRVHIIACGSSYHAGLVARNWFEGLAGVPCQVEIASEFRYRHPAVEKNTLAVVISQSGETADTIAAANKLRNDSQIPVLGIVNVSHSTLAQMADLVLLTQAGPEIGVASTKAFTTQLVVLLLLVLALGRRYQLTTEREMEIVRQIKMLPKCCEQVLALSKSIKHLSQHFVNKQHALFLGRGVQYPIAMEGALKLKEVSYIHAEAYPAGELKHGPLALVDDSMPVISVAPKDGLLEKLKSNLQEVAARGGLLTVFADEQCGFEGQDDYQVIKMPEVGEHIAPILYAVPLQLLAYYVAVLRGTDVDQPRNLAKSVTVE